MPIAKTSVKLVCFDLGGVLVRIAKGWVDACQRAGVDLPHANESVWERHKNLMLRYETGEIDAAGYMAEAPGVIGGGGEPDALLEGVDARLAGVYPPAPGVADGWGGRGGAPAGRADTNQPPPQKKHPPGGP